MKSFRSYVAAGVGFAMLVTIIFMATGWGSAVASTISNVYVTNTSAHPVPVQEQGTSNVTISGGTQKILDQTITGDAALANIDVSAYKTVRLIVIPQSRDNCDEPDEVQVYAGGPEMNGDSIRLDTIDFCATNQQEPPTRVFEVPGQQLHLGVVATPNDVNHVLLYGRSN
jgi:hypothetical protein